MMKMKFIALAIALAGSGSALAIEQGDFKFDGFGTAGITKMGGDLEGRSYGVNGQIDDGASGDAISKLGGQFKYGVTDKIDVTAQVIAKAEKDTWKANVEWLYVAGHVTDELTLRAGRLRTPVYMYSETLDVGYSYPWLRLPDEVYTQVQLTNFEGVDASYTLPVAMGSLNFQGSFGQAVNRNYYIYDMLKDVDYKDYKGLAATYSTDSFGNFRASWSEAEVALDRADPIHARFASYGYQFDDGLWLISSEKTRRVLDGSGGELDAFYVMGGRRMGDFLAHVTHAEMKDEDLGVQKSITYGLNYSLTPSVTLKSEYKRVDTTRKSAGSFVNTTGDLKNDFMWKMSGGAMGTPLTSHDGDIFAVGVDFVF